MFEKILICGLVEWTKFLSKHRLERPTLTPQTIQSTFSALWLLTWLVYVLLNITFFIIISEGTV